MKPHPAFPEEIIAKIHKERILRIRAGTDSTHRNIGIWAVVVQGRVFVRSWALKSPGWWRTFLEDPHGSIFINKHEIPIRALQIRSERLNDLVSTAYREKYNTRGSIQYAEDMSRKISRDTTTELLPR